MRSISDTLERLKAWTDAFQMAPAADVIDRLDELDRFGSNPGDLRARTYVPKGIAAGAPLVVVLHGCTQTAAAYDHGAGWSRLADAHGFALLFPEQRRSNNPNLCFNWFQPEDNRRGRGEALSIRQMVAAMQLAHGTDPERVFVTGLSAGGAMTAAMLAIYPEVFAGGAILAGVPYGAADTVSQALDRMRGHGLPEAQALAARVRGASIHHTRWPILSLWHGREDTTVDAANAEAISAQWRALHDIDPHAFRVDVADGHPRRIWHDRAGRDVIEEYDLADMGHGTPLATLGPDGLGVEGPHMIEAGISSTHHIARFWGILDASPVAAVEPPEEVVPDAAFSSLFDSALRVVGLMR